MTNLTCPYPENINPLTSNGFLFTVEKLPELKYFSQSAVIPQISISQVDQSNPFVNLHHPGEKINFDPITVNFMIDENMNNYIAIYKWMIGLGFPESNQQYSDFLKNQRNALTEVNKVYSDGTLVVLGHDYTAVRTVEFVDLFPIALSSVEFSSNNTDAPPVIGSVTFSYNFYKFKL